jgi:hypothetical protein
MGKVRRHLLLAGKGGEIPPLFQDNFSRANGPLGSPWVGSTYTISGGQAINSPTLGAEMLTDPGLEANYTGGLCDTLWEVGAATYYEETSDPHGGSKAQGMQPSANQEYIYHLSQPSPAAGVWHFVTWWNKIVSAGWGHLGVRIYGAGQTPGTTLVPDHGQNAAWTQRKALFRAGTSSANFRLAHQWAEGSPYDDILLDDVSYKPISDNASLFATVDLGEKDIVITLKGDVTHGVLGIVARLDSTSNPQNYVICWLYRHSTYHYVITEKCVGGTYTTIATGANLGEWSGTTKALKLRLEGTTIQVFYDGAQIGSNLTVSDAGIVDNTKHGLFIVGAPATLFKLEEV